MIICDVCTGFHATSNCVTARRHVETCITSGTVDDYERPNNVVQLVTDLTYVKQPAGRAMVRRTTPGARKDNVGVNVRRIA